MHKSQSLEMIHCSLVESSQIHRQFLNVMNYNNILNNEMMVILKSNNIQNKIKSLEMNYSVSEKNFCRKHQNTEIPILEFFKKPQL